MVLRILNIQKAELLNRIDGKYALLFGRNQSAETAAVRRQEWSRITADLNAMGVRRTVNDWKRCFSNMKLLVRKKQDLIRAQRSRTRSGGGALSSVIELSEMDKRIIRLCGRERREPTLRRLSPSSIAEETLRLQRSMHQEALEQTKLLREIKEVLIAALQRLQQQ